MRSFRVCRSRPPGGTSGAIWTHESVLNIKHSFDVIGGQIPPGVFYAESVSQPSPGLPDECRATLGIVVPAPKNPVRDLKARRLTLLAQRNPYRVGFFCNDRSQGSPAAPVNPGLG